MEVNDLLYVSVFDLGTHLAPRPNRRNQLAMMLSLRMGVSEGVCVVYQWGGYDRFISPPSASKLLDVL